MRIQGRPKEKEVNHMMNRKEMLGEVYSWMHDTEMTDEVYAAIMKFKHALMRGDIEEARIQAKNAMPDRRSPGVSIKDLEQEK